MSTSTRETLNASTILSMTNPMMPRGVEHQELASGYMSQAKEMTNPMMPRGVEHVLAFVVAYNFSNRIY